MHTIKNKQGKHIIDKKIRDEIIHALDHGFFYTYYNDTKIEIVSDFRTEEGRETIVKIDI